VFPVCFPFCLWILLYFFPDSPKIAGKLSPQVPAVIPSKLVERSKVPEKVVAEKVSGKVVEKGKGEKKTTSGKDKDKDKDKNSEEDPFEFVVTKVATPKLKGLIFYLFFPFMHLQHIKIIFDLLLSRIFIASSWESDVGWPQDPPGNSPSWKSNVVLLAQVSASSFPIGAETPGCGISCFSFAQCHRKACSHR